MNFLFRGASLGLLLLIGSLLALGSRAQPEDARVNLNKTTSQRVARISLESRGLDLGDKFADDSLLLLTQTPHNEPVRATTTTTNSSNAKTSEVRRKGKKSERAGRRLSNIWSMFLPGSSSSDDYEDVAAPTGSNNGAAEESLEETGSGGAKPNATLEAAAAAAVENNEEKLVAKLAGNQRSPVQRTTGGVSRGNDTGELHSAPLMSSASTRINSQSADMNDIMANIMSSMGANLNQRPPMDPVEREDDLPEGLVASNNKTASKEGDQFERWLNKIKFRDSERDTQANSTGVARKPLAEAVVKQEPRRGELAGGRVSFVDRKQEQPKHAHLSKTSAVKTAPVHQFARLRQSPAQQLAAARQKTTPQQPYAQASTATIEVNADENNNSTAAAAHQKQMLPGNLTEVSPVEQSLLQSQDEILKQVTNAINFEQQQLSSKRENLKSSAPQEDSKSTPDSKEDDTDSFKLFRVGTSMNELIDGSGKASSNKTLDSSLPARVAANETGESGANKTSGDSDMRQIIKSLSEKLGGSEKQLSSDQPMWLQHKLHLGAAQNLLSKGNLSRLAANLAAEGAGKQLEKWQLEQLRELVEKHERTKNELRSSQESMYQFLRQFMGAEASLKLLASQDSPSANGSQKAAPQHPAGWTPMTLGGGGGGGNRLEAGLDKFYAQRPRGNQPPLRISQLKDNLGQGEDMLEKENYLSELSGHYKELLQQKALEQQALHQGSSSGELEDPESSQLELAAHELVKPASVSRPRFKVDPRPHLGTQKLAALAESMLGDSKLGGRFSPRHFMQSRKRQPAPAIHGEEEHPVQQQSEGSEQLRDPMTRQTSSLKVSSSSDASSGETLRQKDSALLITRSRLTPQMLAQLNLPAGAEGPPTKIQLSLEATPNQAPLVGGSAKFRLPNPFAGAGMTGSFVPAEMAHDAGLRAPIVAANLPSNNLPVRFREVSIYRPFGYESHHAIAYQASPAIAALFPGFAQSTRPSMLRHMTPFRAIQTQRGLINPITPAFQVVDSGGPGPRTNQAPPPPAAQDSQQFQQAASMSTHSLPVDGMSRIRPGFAPAGSLLKRQSHRTKAHLMGANKWPGAQLMGHRYEPRLVQSRLKIRRSSEEQTERGFTPMPRNRPSGGGAHPLPAAHLRHHARH